MIGCMFVLAGVMLLRQAGPVAWNPGTDVAGTLMGALVATGFLVLSAWALFFSGGPSAWGMSGSLPVGMLPKRTTAWLFYLVQGAGAGVCILLFGFAWRQLYRAVVAARSGTGSGRLE